MRTTRVDEIKWTTTDQHFGHKKLMKVARPEFNELKEMHAHILLEHNSVVKKDDVVLFMGDLGFRDAVKENVPKMNGYKILILGNHDNYSNKFYEGLFDEVYKHPIFYHNRIVFSHVPVMVSPGTINVHGHIHDMELDHKQYFNICPEVRGYTPTSIKKIKLLMQNIQKENIHFLQEWWREIQIPMPTHKNRGLVLKPNGTIDAANSQQTLALFRRLQADGKTNKEILEDLKYTYRDLTFY